MKSKMSLKNYSKMVFAATLMSSQLASIGHASSTVEKNSNEMQDQGEANNSTSLTKAEEEQLSNINLSTLDPKNPSSPLTQALKEAGITAERIKAIYQAKHPILEREIAKTKVVLPVDISETLGIFGVEVHAKRTVQPTNSDAEQLRTDVYTIKMRTKGTLDLGVKFSVTFAKLFRLQDYKAENFSLFDLKKKALDLTDVPFLDDIPFNADEVETKLKHKQVVRIEIDAIGGLRDINERKEDRVKTKANVGYNKGATFLAEIGRIDQTKFRTRFLAIKKKGEFSGAIGARKSLTPSFLPGKIGKILSIGAEGSCRAADTVFHTNPIDSMMVTYRFNMADTEARSALQEIFTNIKKGGFLKIYNLSINEAEIADELLKYAGQAEKIATDLSVPFEKRSVQHEFKGRMIGKGFQCGSEANISIGASGALRGGGSTTFVKKYDDKNQLHYYILDSHFGEAEYQLASNLVHSKKRRGLDLLALADKDKNAIKVIQLVDKLEQEKSSTDIKDMTALKEKIIRAVPTIATERTKNDQLNSSIPTDKAQHSTSLSIETSINENGIEALGAIPYANLGMELYNIINNHPEKRAMNLNDHPSGEATANSLYTDIVEPIALDLNYTFTLAEKKNSLSRFRNQKPNLLIRNWVVPEFLPRILNQTRVSDGMELKVNFSSNEGKRPAFVYGGGSPSATVFKAVKYMQKLLDDRRFEVRLDSDLEAAGISEDGINIADDLKSYDLKREF